MFFDCLNVRNKQEHIQKRKPFLEPYSCVDDSRFEWLEFEFLKYLDDWKKSIEERNGEFSKAERQTMFISLQTYQGLLDQATVAVGTNSGRRNSNGYFQVAMGLGSWKSDGERGIVGV